LQFKAFLTTSVAVGALLVGQPAFATSYVSIFGGATNPKVDGVPISSREGLTIQDTSHRYRYYFGTFSYSNPPSTYFVARYYSRYVSYRSFVATFYTASSFSDTQIENGFVLGAAIGSDIRPNMRAELEVAFRHARLGGDENVNGIAYKTNLGTLTFTYLFGKVYHYSTASATTHTAISGLIYVRTNQTNSSRTTRNTNFEASSSGEATSFSIMSNFWFDFEFSETLPIASFVGGGVGVSHLDIQHSASIDVLDYRYSFETQSDDWVFAWQVGAGLGYEFESGMMLSAQYRYFATGDIGVGGQDFGLSSHEALIGMSFPLGN